MGIFSRLFQRGQDGNPADASTGDEHDDANDEPESTQGTGAGAPAAATAAPSAAATAPAATGSAAVKASKGVKAATGATEEPAAPGGPAFQAPAAGLTPAFATPGSTPAPGTSAESPRSMWEWQGPQPQREARRGGERAASASSAASQSSSSSDPPPSAAPPEQRTSPRAGAVTSVPRNPTTERDPTMVLSPPPAPTPAPSRGVKQPAASPSTPAAQPAPPKSSPSVPAPAKSSPAAAPAASGRAAPPATAAPAQPAAAVPAQPVVPAAAAPAARAKKTNSITDAFEAVLGSGLDEPAAPGHGVSTTEDLAEVRRVFNDVAAIHVAQVRDVMLELQYGDAEASWIESTQPALRSLRSMAGQMELTDLVQALDEFCVAVDAAVAGRARIGDDAKAELLGRYQRLIELIPQAFELDAERDRREPLIVEALLYQIEGVEKRTIEKLFAVGLNRLDALMRATADEIAVVAGLHEQIARAIFAQFQTYRTGANAALSAPDPIAERRQLGELLIMLTVQNDEFTHASSQWTEDARARKHEARKLREQTFQRIKVALARLGERDQLARMEKLPFDERISMLDRYLSAAVPARPQPGKS
jgi:hypothetical protein